MNLTHRRKKGAKTTVLVLPDAFFHHTYYLDLLNTNFDDYNWIIVEYELPKISSNPESFTIVQLGKLLLTHLEAEVSTFNQTTILGHSMGGKLALHLYKNAPSFLSLILLNTALSPISQEYRDVILLNARTYFQNKFENYHFADHIAKNVFQQSSISSNIYKAWINQFLTLEKDEFWMQTNLAIQYHKEEEIIKALKCPTLFIYGQDNKIIPKAHICEVILHSSRYLQYSEIPKGSHSLIYDEPGHFKNILTEFTALLDQVNRVKNSKAVI